jgi:hypothetical protein
MRTLGELSAGDTVMISYRKPAAGTTEPVAVLIRVMKGDRGMPTR